MTLRRPGRPHADSRLAKYVATRVLQLKPRKSQAEIASEAGFPNANFISMIKNGTSKLALDRVPALAKALECDAALLFRMALEQLSGSTTETANRALYGPKWQQHFDESTWWFAFLEKPGSNPHWHVLLRVVGRWGVDPSNQFARLADVARFSWLKIAPAGTIDIHLIPKRRQKKLTTYLAKELGGELQYSNFLTPDEFRCR